MGSFSRRILVLALILAIIAVATTTAFADTASDVATIRAAITNYYPFFNNHLVDLMNTTENIRVALYALYNNTFYGFQDRFQALTNAVGNMNQYFNAYGTDVVQDIFALRDFIVDPQIQQAKDDYASRSAIVADDFLSSSGSASASLSDFGGVASGLSDIKSSFSGGGSAADAFSVLSGSGVAWGWYTDAVKNDMDSTTVPSSLRSRSVSDFELYPAYNERLSAIDDYLSLNHD